MKKKYVLLILGIGILMWAYSVLAAKAVRGIGIYTMQPAVGQFLSVSRHYTAAVSAIFLVISIVFLVKNLMKKRATRMESQSAIQKDMPEFSESLATASAETVEMTSTDTLKSVAEPTAIIENRIPKCIKCGAPIKEDARFCEKCGERITKSASEEEQEN